MVILHDGRVVHSSSEEWRAECEARHVLRLPDVKARRAYLRRAGSKRGEAARAQLETHILALWQHQDKMTIRTTIDSHARDN